MGLSDWNIGTVIRPGSGAFEITPSNTNELAYTTRAVYIGVDGDLRVTMVNDDVVTFVGMLGGVLYPIQVKQVWSTGTDADSIVGIY